MFRKAKRGYGNAGHPSVSLIVRPSVRPSEICCKRSKIFICWPIDFKLIHKHYSSNLYSLSSKLGKIVRMVAMFKMSAKTHQNFKVLQFKRKLIFRRFCFYYFNSFIFLLTDYHRIWNNAVAVRHPSLWTFIRCMKDQQSSLENSVEAVDNGESAPKRRTKWQNWEDRLQTLETEYNNGTRNLDQHWNAVYYAIVQFLIKTVE